MEDKRIAIKNLTPQEENTFLFRVEVLTRDGSTNHIVSVDRMYYQKLADNAISSEELVRLSFDFLLERESNQAILTMFDLKDVTRYFPSYEEEIRHKIHA